MKRFIFFLVLVLFASGCGTMTRTRSVVVGFADYRPFTTAGMVVSPDPYTGADYTAIGEFHLEIRPAWVADGANLKAETMTPSDILEIVVAEARKRGANGIVDYRVTPHYSSSGLIDVYEVYALLILIHEL